MASAIFFNGRRINVPQAVSKLDASALAGVSPAAVGIVALVGTAEGGKPLDASSDFDLTRAEKALERYRSGNLRKATQFCFQPSADDAVPGGAQRIVPVKVNPATQGAVTLPDDSAGDALVLTSRDWGLFVNQINVQIAAGTNQGKEVTIVFEDEVELFDDVGGDAVVDLLYTPGSEGYDTMLATLSATTFVALATKANIGLDTERTADIPATGVVRINSDNAADVGINVTVYGLDGSNVPVKQVLALNGTTDVDGTQNMAKVLGVEKASATVGTITVSDTVIPTTLFTLAPATLTRGILKMTNAVSAGAFASAALDATSANDAAIFGKNASGADVAERYDFTGSASVAGAVAFATVDVIAIGDIPAARTFTLTTNAVSHAHTAYSTVQKFVDRLNALAGFTANALTGDAGTYLMADLDAVTSQSLLVAYDFTGDLQAIIDKLNESSAYVSAARASGATAPPANTVSAVFLEGGSEGVTTISEWQAAFSALKKRRVNIIVPLTEDPAVHSLLLSHLVERSGKLRSEANGYAGIGTSGGAGETKSNIKSQIQALNSRHVSALVQEVQRFDPDTGAATFYPPWMFGVIAAGMQAGSAIGEPLTHKFPICTDIRNDASWSVEDDVEELIDAGAMLAENVDGLGIRFIRSITTHLRDDNLVFTEMSANESANTSVFRLRRQLELQVGKRGLGGTANAIKGIASTELGKQIDEEIVVAWRNLQVEQVGDVFPVSVEIAPISPVNFIPITVHLVAATAAA